MNMEINVVSLSLSVTASMTFTLCCVLNRCVDHKNNLQWKQ